MTEPVDRLGLRFRVFLLFALIALSVPVLLGLGLWLAADRLTGNPGPPLVLFGGAAGFALIGVITWVWMRFDVDFVAPLQRLTRDLETLTHSNPDHEIQSAKTGTLGALFAATRDAGEALTTARRQIEDQVSRATRAAEEQRNRLEAVLRDLHEGVMICNFDHQILLYNQRALQILRLTRDLGLGRSLFTVVNRQPFLHALEQLFNSLAQAEDDAGRFDHSALVVCATVDGRYVLEGRVSLIVEADEGTASGYVVTFQDATGKLAILGKRDRLLREAIDGLRRPLANLRAATEMLVGDMDMDAEDRKEFEGVLDSECEALSRHLEGINDEYRDLVTGHWPMSDVYSANVLNCVVRRLRDERLVDSMMTGVPIWLHCDSHSVVELLDHMVHRVAKHSDVATFDLEASSASRRCYIDISWQGEVVPSGRLETWLDEPLEEQLGGLTGRDVLERHRSEVWCDVHREGWARIRLPLPAPVEDHSAAKRDSAVLPERPEFYDFDLLRRIEASAAVDRPLRELTYVVFDTETTGLEPSKGDEIISIAGVRIVNGRILTGESFSELVNPQRGIPKESIKFHGITEEMVRDKPKIEQVLQRFHDFVGDAVLVAHNAAFDLKFLSLKQDLCGVKFDSAVLDTVLLSAFLHDHTNQHTLDAVAERFGIEIQGRHTALGDSLVTAGAFLRMIELLEARNIVSLGQAIEVSNKIVEIRRQQARY
ncbi:MAG: exonuclease domain-containing protein [Kiloniellales bacterium]|nr:exonuclease domain-containing protein [Kiloniellales bacterium]